MVRTITEIRDKIRSMHEIYGTVLDQPLATLDENAPVALIQLEATSRLGMLYWVLGEKSPDFKCDSI